MIIGGMLMKYPSREFAICLEHSNFPVIASRESSQPSAVPRTTLPSLMAPPRWVFNVSGPFGCHLCSHITPHVPPSIATV